MNDDRIQNLLQDLHNNETEYNLNDDFCELDDTFTILGQYENDRTTETDAVNCNSELTFEYNACYLCNGYYGPCFEDPLCATCHVFLYPNVLPALEIPPLKQVENSDSDSGNDEPVDSMFKPNGLDVNEEGRSSLQSYLEKEYSMLVEKYSMNLDDKESSSKKTKKDILPNKLAPVVTDTLSLQLKKLSEPSECIPNLHIDLFPVEVLIHTFQYLDEISLWSIGQVCRRWRSILLMYVKPHRWKEFTLSRWPLLKLQNINQDWHELYTSMMNSSCCFKCIKQMAAQEIPPNWEDDSWRKHRLMTELKLMRTDPLDGIEADPLDPACCHWQATLEGPAGSPYEGGLFFLYIQVPVSYPLQPPIVRFLTKIFHPNISRHGDIGIDSIHQNWSLALTMSKLLISIQSLLTDPFCDVCMEPEICDLYCNNKKVFEEQARKWTAKYAMHDILPHLS